MTLRKRLTLQTMVIDVMSLTGDAVDNVPGVKGIGKVTAAKIINRWGSLDAALLSAITGYRDSVMTDRIARLLIEQMENALMSRELVRLDRGGDEIEFAE